MERLVVEGNGLEEGGARAWLIGRFPQCDRRRDSFDVSSWA